MNEVSVRLHEKTILHKISLEVEKGDFIGLIGPNGSGKSTLIKTIADLIKCSSGSLKIQGIESQTLKPKELACLISYVPQNAAIDFDFTVEEIVKMGRHVHGSLFMSTSSQDEEIVEKVLQLTGTYHLKERSILSLSGGQRQLVFIAKALAQNTPILLLDEPISALDIHFQLHILFMLQVMTQEGKTIIVVLHDLNLAARFCSKLMLLQNGEIKNYGTPEHVLTQRTVDNTYEVESDIREHEVVEALNVTALLPKRAGEKT